MPSSKAPIEVPEALARAYREASPEQRERAERAMAYALLSRSEVAREFRRITERASDYAAEQGLTQDTLDALLHEDDGG
jgi:hypothetical protein